MQVQQEISWIKAQCKGNSSDCKTNICELIETQRALRASLLRTLDNLFKKSNTWSTSTR